MTRKLNCHPNLSYVEIARSFIFIRPSDLGMKPDFFTRFIFLALMLILSTHPVQASPLKASWKAGEPLGTGHSTGLIGTIDITNDGQSMLALASQMVFIPASGKYQSYIGRISESRIEPGKTLRVSIFGYCIDVSLSPVPDREKLPPLKDWVHIETGTQVTSDKIRLISNKQAALFTTALIPQIQMAAGIQQVLPDTSATQTFLWPGTEIPMLSRIGPGSDPTFLASISSSALLTLEAVLNQSDFTRSLPMGLNDVDQIEIVIQHSLWIYLSSIQGQPYIFQDLERNIDSQVQRIFGPVDSIQQQKIRQTLHACAQCFWNACLAAATEGGLIRNERTDSSNIQHCEFDAPDLMMWEKIKLTGMMMKPGYPFAPPKTIWSYSPIIGGVLAAGVGGYVFLRQEKDTMVCDVFLPRTSTPDTCSMGKGAVEFETIRPDYYHFQWSTGDTGPSVSGLQHGVMYSVTISIPNTSCQRIWPVYISNFDEFYSYVETKPASCSLSDGSAAVRTTISQGSFPFSYRWSTGDTTQSIKNLGAGMYSVTVTAFDCIDQVYPFEISAKSLELNPGFAIQPANCGRADGSIAISLNDQGPFHYLWSTSDTAATLINAISGNYTVTISTSSTCKDSFSIVIPELEPHYLVIDSIQQSYCDFPTGNIFFSIQAPPSQHVLVSIRHEGDTLQLNLPTGQYALSDFMNVGPGGYYFNARDTLAESHCYINESVGVSNVLMQLVLDQYATTINTPISENMLANDFGVGLKVFWCTVNIGGQVSYSENGDFTFTPDPGFTGMARLAYIAHDTCGTEKNEFIFVNVTTMAPAPTVEIGYPVATWSSSSRWPFDPEHALKPAWQNGLMIILRPGGTWNRYAFRIEHQYSVAGQPGASRTRSTLMEGILNLWPPLIAKIPIDIHAGIGYALNRTYASTGYDVTTVPFASFRLSFNHSFTKALILKLESSALISREWLRPSVSLYASTPLIRS